MRPHRKSKILKGSLGAYIEKQEGVAGDSTPWDPSQLPDLKIWLEADDVNVTTTAIDQFNDKSGNGHHFTSTLTARATLLSAELNGQDIAQFDGSSDWYTCSSGQILAETEAHTVIVVAKHKGYGAAGDFDVVLNLKANANRCYQMWFTNQASYSEVAFGFANAGGTNNMVVRATPNLGTVNYNCLIQTFVGSNDEQTASYTLEKNGANVTVNTAANATATYANELGRWSSGSLFANIDLALVIVMGSVITGDDRALLEAWVADKYGLTFS